MSSQTEPDPVTVGLSVGETREGEGVLQEPDQTQKKREAVGKTCGQRGVF